MKIKKNIVTTICLVNILASLVGCQTIAEKEQLIPVDRDSIRSNRTTLICEFTGYKCVNCPNAAKEAHKLLELWGENLVVVEMHPPSNSFTNFGKKPEYDYTCPAADIYYQHFEGWKEIGLPQGTINLKGGFTSYMEWGGAYIRSAVAQTTVELRAATEYSETTRTLNASVELANLSEKAQNLQLVAWLTEDSILGGQQMPDGSFNTAYYHNHLLRDTLTAAWGEPIEVRTTRSVELKPYVLSERYDASHCNLVVLALRDDEVVQALQVKVKG